GVVRRRCDLAADRPEPVRRRMAVVALSVITGTILAGVVGAVVSVPMVSVAWSVLSELRVPRARPEPDHPGRSPD
ncbi:hypothetical protein ABZT43_51440, partial [Streptomyces sp. NPDC005349]